MENNDPVDDNIEYLDFKVAASALQAISMQNLQEVTLIQIDLLRNFESKLYSQQSYPYLIYYFRSLIQHFEQLFKDFKPYFSDLKMPFLYDLFHKIQLIMIHGVNLISQALMTNIKQIDDQNQHQKDHLGKQKLINIKLQEFEEKKIKIQLQKCDRTIYYFENKQNQINEQMRLLSNKIWQSKAFIEKLSPSYAVKEISQIKQISEGMLSNTSQIFQDPNAFRFRQCKNYIQRVRPSQEISDQLCKNIGFSIKEKFSKGVKNTVKKIVQLKEKDNQSRQVDCSTQTEKNEKEILSSSLRRNSKKIQMLQSDKIQSFFQKEKKNKDKGSSELYKNSKILKVNNLQKQIIRFQIQELQQKLKQKNESYETLAILYQQKQQELFNQHIQYQKLQSANNVTISNIKNKIKGVTSKHQSIQINLSPFETVQNYSQTGFFENQNITYLKNYVNRLKQNVMEHRKSLKQVTRQNYLMKCKYENRNEQKKKYLLFSIQRVIQIIVSNQNNQNDNQIEEGKGEGPYLDSYLEIKKQINEDYLDLQSILQLKIPTKPLDFIKNNSQQKQIKRISIFNKSFLKIQKKQMQTQTQNEESHKIPNFQVQNKKNHAKYTQMTKNSDALNKRASVNMWKNDIKPQNQKTLRQNIELTKNQSKINKHKYHKTTLNLAQSFKFDQVSQKHDQNSHFQRIQPLYDSIEGLDHAYLQKQKKSTFQILNMPNEYKNKLQKRGQLKKKLMIQYLGKTTRKPIVEDLRNSTICISLSNDDKLSMLDIKFGSKSQRNKLTKIDKINMTNVSHLEKFNIHNNTTCMTNKNSF